MGMAEWLTMALLAAANHRQRPGAAIAYQVGPSATVATFDFSYVGFAVLWGFLFFDEVLDPVTLHWNGADNRSRSFGGEALSRFPKMLTGSVVNRANALRRIGPRPHLRRGLVMKLYSHWRSSASYRVRIALNLKALTCEQVTLDLDKSQQHNIAPSTYASTPRAWSPPSNWMMAPF